jgi:hypothetical protein
MMSLSYSTMQCYYMVRCCSCLYAADEFWYSDGVYMDCLFNFRPISRSDFLPSATQKAAVNVNSVIN